MVREDNRGRFPGNSSCLPHSEFWMTAA